MLILLQVYSKWFVSFVGKMSIGCNIVKRAQSENKIGTPNKRWTNEMESVLISLLADIARSGLKVDKSFKRQAFVKAVNVVNNRSSATCMDADNVKNHMSTFKQKIWRHQKVYEPQRLWMECDIKNVSARRWDLSYIYWGILVLFVCGQCLTLFILFIYGRCLTLFIDTINMKTSKS